MKYISYISFLALSLIPLNFLAQTCDLIDEDFEDSSNINFPDNWIFNESFIGTNNPRSGLQHAGFNTLNDEVIIQNLFCPSVISFYWRASGASSNYDITISYSDDNENSWTTLETISLNGSGSPTTYSELEVDLPQDQFQRVSDVSIRILQSRRTNGSFYMDDVCVSSDVCVIRPSKLTFTQAHAGCLASNSTFSLTVCAVNDEALVAETFAETIRLTSDGSTGTLTGTTSITPENGCAVFNDLRFSDTDTYVISAESDSFSSESIELTAEPACGLTQDLKVMTYNLLNFPNGRSDCDRNLPSRWDTLRKILQYVQPDVLMVCELQTEAGSNMILNEALNTNGLDHYRAANFVLNQSSIVTELNNMFYYNSEKLTLVQQTEVTTDLRDINHYTTYVNDSQLATHSDTTFIDFFVAHLKAGSSASDISRRTIECQALRDYIDAQGNLRNSIFGGDFNFTSSDEPGYEILSSGTYPFNDPIQAPGSWEANTDFLDIHTQSTRAFGVADTDCGITGGMDSRFDFLLISDGVIDGDLGVDYVEESYTALGNNGTTFNSSINDTGNTSGVPDSVLNALFYTSDHLPVIMDLLVTFPIVASNCVIESTDLSNIECLDNSTLSDASDDYIRFSLNPQGSNLSANYTVSVDQGTISPSGASYGASQVFELQAGSAGGGEVTLTVTDGNDASCTLEVVVDDPGICSTMCTLADINPNNIECLDNGTPSDSSDDYVRFSLNPQGTNLSANYTVSVDQGTISPSAASYGASQVFELQAGSAGGGDVTLTVTDGMDASCTLEVVVDDPGICSTMCTLADINPASIECLDNGTPSDSSDDYVRFSLNPQGNNLSANYTVSVDQGTINPSAASYGANQVFELQAGSAGGGGVTLTVTDGNDSSCSLQVVIDDPGACSTVCGLSDLNLSNIECRDNGTPSDASDDYIRFSLNPQGSNLSANYTVSVDRGSIGPSAVSYGTSQVFELQAGSAGGGDVTLTVTDGMDASCTLEVVVDDPGTCHTTTAVSLTELNDHISVYPNPVDDLLRISIEHNKIERIGRIDFLDLGGRTALTIDVGHSSVFEIDVSYLPVGVYIVRINVDQLTFHKKIIVVR